MDSACTGEENVEKQATMFLILDQIAEFIMLYRDRQTIDKHVLSRRLLTTN